MAKVRHPAHRTSCPPFRRCDRIRVQNTLRPITAGNPPRKTVVSSKKPAGAVQETYRLITDPHIPKGSVQVHSPGKEQIREERLWNVIMSCNQECEPAKTFPFHATEYHSLVSSASRPGYLAPWLRHGVASGSVSFFANFKQFDTPNPIPYTGQPHFPTAPPFPKIIMYALTY